MDVFDVSNPATPMLIAALNLPYAINRIVIAGNLAYLRSLSNVEVIDISDPATPRIVADFAPLYATEDYRRTMAAFGDHILFGYTSPGQGIQSMPQQCALSTSVPGAGVSHETRGVRLDVAPNPGRRTSIGFSMPASGAATLEVIDVTGRRVMSLHAGVLAAGTWTFGWDGRDASGAEAAPGIYFIALRTETGSRSERFVLAR
jgi:hypothetical protein